MFFPPSAAPVATTDNKIRNKTVSRGSTALCAAITFSSQAPKVKVLRSRSRSKVKVKGHGSDLSIFV